jgi:hypothetical protein
MSSSMKRQCDRERDGRSTPGRLILGRHDLRREVQL